MRHWIGLIIVYFSCISVLRAQCPNCHNNGRNLITNPSFEAGNIGFKSGYLYGANGAGHYTIDTNAANFFGGFVGKDHTSGLGKFMIVDGSGNKGLKVWEQDIDSIIPHQNYYFSAWVCNLYNPPYCILQFSINGVNQAQTFSPGIGQGIWTQFYIVWNSGDDTTATIALINQNTQSNGNDFGLDDISFSTCEPNPVLLLDLGPDDPLCLGQSRFLDAGAGMDSIKWDDGSNGRYRSVNAAGTYWVSVWKGSCSASDTLKIIAVQLPPFIFLGNDITSCDDSVLLNAKNYNWPIRWYKDGQRTNDTSHQLWINRSGTYIAEAGSGTCRSADTVQITLVDLPQNFLGKDSTLCLGDTLRLTTDIPGVTYLWNDGDTSRTKEFYQSGNYILRIAVPGCSSNDTVSYTFNTPPSISLGPDTLMCFYDSIYIGSPCAGCSYAWMINGRWQGIADSIILVTGQGMYRLRVEQGPCKVFADKKIQVSNGYKINVPDTAWLCADMNDTVILRTGGQRLGLWEPGNILDSVIYIQQAAVTYSVKLSDSIGCITSDSTYIKEACPPKIYIPNAFSPNKNLINELYIVKGAFITKFHIRIWNRWGELMYESYDISQGWDGNFHDKPCQAGLYIYSLEYEGMYQGKIYGDLKEGHLMLMR